MQRVISGVVLAAAALAAIWFLPPLALRVLTCVVALLATHEYLKIAGGHDTAAGGAVIACWMISGDYPGKLLIVLVLVATVVVGQVMGRNASIGSASASSFATVYIGVPLGLLLLVQQNFGAKATLFLIASIVVSDTSQYYCGRTFGRHPLAPAISPKKTIEGAIGGVLLGTAFVVIAGQYLFGLKPLITVPVGVAVVALGIMGDLFESRLKRVAGVKDSSDLIPGHGGVLDRIDALLFAIPAFYFMLVRSLV